MGLFKLQDMSKFANSKHFSYFYFFAYKNCNLE